MDMITQIETMTEINNNQSDIIKTQRDEIERLKEDNYNLQCQCDGFMTAINRISWENEQLKKSLEAMNSGDAAAAAPEPTPEPVVAPEPTPEPVAAAGPAPEPEPAAEEPAAEEPAADPILPLPKKRKDNNWRTARAVKSAKTALARETTESEARVQESVSSKAKLKQIEERVKEL